MLCVFNDNVLLVFFGNVFLCVCMCVFASVCVCVRECVLWLDMICLVENQNLLLFRVILLFVYSAF